MSVAPVGGGQQPLQAGILSAGAYALELPGREVSFSLGDGWQATNTASGVGFVLVNGDPSELRALSLFVVPVSPEDAVNLVENTDGLGVDAAGPTTVGGLPGTQIDVTVGGSKGDRVDVIGIGNPTVDVFFVLGGERARFVILDAGGTTIVIVVVSKAGGYEEFLQTAQTVIDSLSFT